MRSRFSSARLVATLLALVPLAAAAAKFAGVEVPPPPAPQPVTDTYWGTSVEDPYRFLESTTDPEVQKLMHAQADATYAILAKIPGREGLLARIKEIDADTPAVVSSVHRDERGGLFYLKREASDNQYKLYWREKAGGADVVLVDPEVEAKAKGTPFAITQFKPSPNGRYVAYGLAGGGGEIGALHVMETATRKEVTPPIDRLRFGAVQWLRDGSGFFYARLAEGYEKRPRAERFLDNHTWLRRLDAPDKDVVVFAAGADPAVTDDRNATGILLQVDREPIVAAVVSHGVDRSESLYLSDRESVLAGKPKWHKVYDRSDQVESVAASHGYLYLMSAKDAPRYKLVRVRLAGSPDLAKAEVVFAPGDAVITEIAAGRDALYVTRREGVVKKLYRVAYTADAKPEPIALPFEGDVRLSDVHPYLEGAIVQLGGWTRAASHYALAPAGASLTPMGLVKPGKYDTPAGVTVREVKVKSHDGVEVPVSILSRSDIKLDGSNPTTVYGYGAYGIVEEPAWNPRVLAWLEQGGVFAIAHVRGGGIFGDGWRRAGWQATKPNTWKDGIAAAEWLVANGYTSPAKLSVYGGSAGGIFVGRAITERPELFSAASISVGNTDSVRSETRANGAGNVPEYGTVKKEDQFRALLVMSPYNNVKAGAKYPAVLLEHGINDSRVDVWMTLKMGSRLAASTTSGKPILMRLESDAGHGPGATREQVEMRTADRYAFFLWQAGVPAFQPGGAP